MHSLQPREGRFESAILTIWNPTEQHSNLVVEGSALQLSNLSVRESEFDGHLQLSASKRTVVEAFECDLESLKQSIAFTERNFLTVLEVHKLSHLIAKRGADVDAHRVDFDTAGCIVKLVEPPSICRETVFYLTDETELIVRVHCKGLPHTLQEVFSDEFPVAAFCDLRLKAFDIQEQCAVAELGDLTSIQLSNSRTEELCEWKMEDSNTQLLQESSRLKLGFTKVDRPCDKRIGVGHIIGLKLDHIDSEKIHIEVDCCGFGIQQWELPMAILHDMLSVLPSGATSLVFSGDENVKLRRLGALGAVFRARGVLWQFQLESKATFASHSQYVICEASVADGNTLAHFFLALPDPDEEEDKKIKK